MSEQEEMWNGPSGRAWVEAKELLDGMFAPFERLLVEAVAEAAPATLLDVGCGTGATTLAFARRLGDATACTGVDLSEPMLAVAREQAARERLAVDFVRADVQRHAFPPGRFEAIVSRFGVMFFDDPVAAFANLRAAAADGAELRCIVWRDVADNPFMTTAERAVAPLLPQQQAAPRDPGAPGQFGLADRDRAAAIVAGGGWGEVELTPLDVVCSFPQAALVPYLSQLGPVGYVLRQAEPAARPAIVATARAAFAPFVHGDEVRFTAACWTLTARA